MGGIKPCHRAVVVEAQYDFQAKPLPSGGPSETVEQPEADSRRK